MMNRVVVVLNRPVYPRNVGMSARAMANLGLTELVVIGAQYKRTDKAKQGAAHAQTVLARSRRYANLSEFLAVEGAGVRIALSGKDARLKTPDDFENCLERLKSDRQNPVHQLTQPIYLMFGTEADGLSPEEIEICHHVCRLPTYSEVNSYNLSHAVLLSLFILRRALFSDHASANTSDLCADAAVVREPAFHPHQTIRTWLETLGFDLSSPRINIEKTLNRILLAQTPTTEELRLLETVLQQTIRKLKSPAVKTKS